MEKHCNSGSLDNSGDQQENELDPAAHGLTSFYCAFQQTEGEKNHDSLKAYRIFQQ